MNLLALLQSVHGHIGVLAAVALVHPALLLAKGRPLSRGGRWAVGLSGGVTTLAFSLGLFLYEDYRNLVKRRLFLEDATAGLLFETKEHLAYAVLALALGATVTAFLAPPGSAGSSLRRLAAALFAGAALTCFIVAGLGTYVASVESF